MFPLIMGRLIGVLHTISYSHIRQLLCHHCGFCFRGRCCRLRYGPCSPPTHAVRSDRYCRLI